MNLYQHCHQVIVVAMVFLLVICGSSNESRGVGVPLPEKQEIFALHFGVFDGESTSLLYEIDPISGVGTMVGDTKFQTLQSLTTGPDGTLYSWDRQDGLITIDPQSGLGTDVNPNAGSGFASLMQSLAFAPDGTLIGIAHIGASSNERQELYRIDTTTGEATLFASAPVYQIRETIRGIEFLGDRLVGVTWDSRTRSSAYLDINADTAALSLVGVTGTDVLNSLAQDANGLLYSVSSIEGATPSSTLFTLDPLTGATVDTLSILTPEVPVPFGFSVRGLTIRTIPEPASLVVALLSLGMLALPTRLLR